MSNKFGVRDDTLRALALRMEALGIRESDLDEQFIRGSGPGGQKVNKTSSAVRLKHLPSGTEVREGRSRSQSLNRFYARRKLCEQLEGTSGPRSESESKIRKQKARRRRRAKHNSDV